YAFFSIIVDQRLCLLMVNFQTFGNSLRFIVVTQHKSLSAGITDSLFLRSRINDMIGGAALQAGSSSGHTVDDVLVRHVHIDSVVNFASQFFQSLCQTLCLGDRSGETVQNISVLRVVLLNSVYNQIAGQLIRNKKSLIHISFCFFAMLGSVLNIRTEDIACGNMGDTI